MRTPTKYVSLHNHDGSSAADGLGPAQQHIDFVLENGMDAWAQTNHGHMNAFAAAYLYSQKLRSSGKNFKFIPGVEAYIHPNLDDWRQEKLRSEELAKDAKAAKIAAKKEKEGIKTNIERIGDDHDETVDVETTNALTLENEEETKSNKTFNPVNRRHHIVILPKTPAALKKIFHLVSRGYLDGFYRFPRIDLRALREAAGDDQDIIISSACLTGDVELVTDQGLQTLETVVARVKTGEEVSTLSFNEKTQEREFKPVLWGDITRKNAKLIRIRLKDGKSVTLTPDHKVYTDKGWMEAKDLKNNPGIKILVV